MFALSAVLTNYWYGEEIEHLYQKALTLKAQCEIHPFAVMYVEKYMKWVDEAKKEENIHELRRAVEMLNILKLSINRHVLPMEESEVEEAEKAEKAASRD